MAIKMFSVEMLGKQKEMKKKRHQLKYKQEQSTEENKTRKTSFSLKKISY